MACRRDAGVGPEPVVAASRSRRVELVEGAGAARRGKDALCDTSPGDRLPERRGHDRDSWGQEEYDNWRERKNEDYSLDHLPECTAEVKDEGKTPEGAYGEAKEG